MVFLLLSCGLKQLLPTGPVVGESERTAEFVVEASGVTYVDEPRTAFPVLPVLPWGVAYDLDLVLVDRRSSFDMHEYARVNGPGGPIWLAKDARLGTLEQSVIADVDGLDAFLPELPVRRIRGPVVVEDHGTGGVIDLTLSYENIDGEAVVVEYRGRAPATLEPKRNGGTMGHSRDSLLAVLDVSSLALSQRARMSVDGERLPLRRIAGLVPFAMALVQTQAGLATADLSLAPTEAGFAVTHALPDGLVSSSWTVEDGALVQRADLRTLVVETRDGETTGATVTQWGRATPVMQVAFAPAIPDLRRRFAGEWRGRFVIDVNGQVGHATGEWVARWEGESAVLDVLPGAPWWVAERPMRTTVSYPGDGTATVDIAMLPSESDGRGARNRSPRRE